MRMTIRQHRLMQEKTIADMAAACGVHYNTYMRWERKPDSIKAVDALKIADALHVTLDDIIFAAQSTT